MTNYTYDSDFIASNASLLTWSDTPSCWILAEDTLRAGTSRVMLWGPQGTGKTTAGLLIDSKQPHYVVTFSEDLTVQELLGHYIPKGDRFEFHYGPIARAWIEGAVLVADELGRASGPVLDMMLGILNDPERAQMSLPNGETIKPAPGFRCIATSNTEPDQMTPALQDRFDATVFIDAPHPQIIKRLNKLYKRLGDVVADSYKDPARAISPRRVFAFADHVSKGIDPYRAALLTLGVRAQDFMTACAAVNVILSDVSIGAVA